MKPKLGVVTLLQRHEEVDGRIAHRDSVLDVQPILPSQETGQPEVHANLVTLQVDAATGPDIVVSELRDEAVGRLVEVLILELK